MIIFSFFTELNSSLILFNVVEKFAIFSSTKFPSNNFNSVNESFAAMAADDASDDAVFAEIAAD